LVAVALQFSASLCCRRWNISPLLSSRGQPRTKIEGVHLSFLSLYKRPTYICTSVRRRGERSGGANLPMPTATIWFGERRKRPPAGSGVELQSQTTLGRFMCSFMRFHASFSAFNSCLEIGDSRIPLLAVGLMFPLTFLGCRTPQLEFLVCRGHP